MPYISPISSVVRRCAPNWTTKNFVHNHIRSATIVHSHIVSAALEIKQIADVVFVHNHIEVGNTWSALILEAAEPRAQPNTFFNEKGRRLYLCDMMLHHLSNAQLCAGCSFGSSCRKSCTVVCKEQGPWPGPGARAQPQLRFQSALISSRSNLGAHDSRGLGPGVQGPGPGFRAWAWGPGAGGAPGPGARGPRPGARAQGPWPGPGPGVQGPGPVQRVGTCRVTGPTELRHHKHPNQL